MTVIDWVAPKRWTADRLRWTGGYTLGLLASMLDCIERAGDLRYPAVMAEVVHQLDGMVAELRELVNDDSTNAVP